MAKDKQYALVCSTCARVVKYLTVKPNPTYVCDNCRAKPDYAPNYGMHGLSDDQWNALSNAEKRELNRKQADARRARSKDPQTNTSVPYHLQVPSKYAGDPCVFRGRDGHLYRSNYIGLYYEAYSQRLD